MTTRHALLLLLSLSPLGCAGQPRSAAPTAANPGAFTATTLANRDHHGVALAGFDPVAYFTEGHPLEGDPQIAEVHEGATYHFASDEHRWSFLREPQRYAPAYGGYSGYAASINRLSPVDPRYWQIIDGRLVLQHNQHAFELFNADSAGNLARADHNWPALQARNALPAHYVVNTDHEGLAIAGYDPISYFDGRPMLKSAEHSARYGGAMYRFASEANRARFERDPAVYAPAFGGFCGYAASIGVFAPVDPQIYLIVADRLVLQHTPEALRLFNRDARRSLSRAQQNWPSLVARAGL